MRSIIACAAVMALATVAQAQERATLGVKMSETAGIGAQVIEVTPGTPAAQIGIQPGDRILAIDNQPVTNYQDVIRLIGSQKPQARVDLKVARGVWQATVPVVLGNSATVYAPVLAPAATPAAPAAYAYPVTYPTTYPNYEYTPADIDDQHAFGG